MQIFWTSTAKFEVRDQWYRTSDLHEKQYVSIKPAFALHLKQYDVLRLQLVLRSRK